MRIVCLSDTHGIYQPKDLPDGDVLLHAGDLSLVGEPHEVEQALGWLRKFPHKYKIVIGGNHDNALCELPYLFDEQLKPYKDRTPLILLRGSSTTIITEEGTKLRVFGSSVIPHNNAFRAGARAYMLDGTTARHWGYAPSCDILVTHGPSKGVLDSIRADTEHWGDPGLRAYVEQVKPKLHVFGHVHCGAGQDTIGATHFVNAALLNGAYVAAHEPTVVDI